MGKEKHEDYAGSYDRYMEEFRSARSLRAENRKFLMDLYKLSIDEYRYQVSLNWDRNKFFLVSGITVIGAACAMLRFVSDPIAAMLIPVLFMLSAFLGMLGLDAQRVGKKYYRATLDHMYEVWSLLLESNRVARDLDFFDVPPFKMTRGMSARARGEAAPTDSEITPGSFSSHLRKFFILIVIVGSSGAAASAAHLMIKYELHDRLIAAIS